MDGRETLVELRGVKKVFLTSKVETHALSEISLNIHKGDFLVIRGPSGSGKSTLLSIVGLLDHPTSGTYSYRGDDTIDMSLTQRARTRNQEFGFVFQSFNLVHEMNILDNVGLPLKFRRSVSKQERHERANDMLKRVGIEHRAEHYPAQLSGGQQQRAAIARALIVEPTLVLADEPTGNLDEDSANVILELLGEMHAEGTTICVVSHDPVYSSRAERRLDLQEGRLVSQSAA